jgi:hypothetical protein
MTDRALRGRHVPGHPLAIGVGIGFFKIVFKKFKNTLEMEAFFAARFFAV